MKYPRHVGIIPDGNRTWAKENSVNKKKWHIQWTKRAKKIIKYCFDETDIETVTIWWASTENTSKRSKTELRYLYKIIKNFGNDIKEYSRKNKINFRWAGSWDSLPDSLVDFLEDMENEFNYEDSNKTFVLAFDYGGQDEIVRWVNKMLDDINDWEKKEITKDKLQKYLDFSELPRLDLVIRTKGNLARRTSGFMSWWIWYSELYFTDTKFPWFDIWEFEKALERFDNIKNERNFGK